MVSNANDGDLFAQWKQDVLLPGMNFYTTFYLSCELLIAVVWRFRKIIKSISQTIEAEYRDGAQFYYLNFRPVLHLTGFYTKTRLEYYKMKWKQMD